MESGSIPCVCSFEHPKKLRDVNVMANLALIGKGTYGAVYKALDSSNGSYVALKMIKMEKETQGFPVTALREIKILKLLKHENIVNLKEIVTYDGNDKNTEYKKEGFVRGDVFMVLDYVDNDLAGLLESPSIVLTDEYIQCYMKQILDGIFFIHNNKILHRDIKTANILVTKDHQIKIADWGLARSYNSNETSHKYTNPVVTLWYRAPELLLGLREYGFAIDMWSIGCVFAEMKCKGAIFRGKDEAEQLQLIYQICGSPSAELLELYKKFPSYEKIQVTGEYEKSFKTKFPRYV